MVTAYHRGKENSYDIQDWDVNVEERLLDDVLRHEAQNKEAE